MATRESHQILIRTANTSFTPRSPQLRGSDLTRREIPRPSHMRRLIPLLALGLLPIACSGPASPASSRDPLPPADSKGLREAETSLRPTTTPGSAAAARPLAIIAGTPIDAARIAPLLYEASGRAVLEDIALDAALADRLRQANLTISPADIEFERQTLASSVAQSSTASASSELIDRIRRDRGLGPRRFEALLARGASLRKLVAPGVTITEEQVSAALQVRYGERRLARIIVANARQDAAEIRQQLDGSQGPELAAKFTELAARRSVDPSNLRGGLLEPISTADSSYPQSIRANLAQLQPGVLSPIIALDSGYAILLLEAVIPADQPPSDARERARSEVTLRAQRVAMERLSRELLAASNVTAFDESLRWSWETRPTR